MKLLYVVPGLIFFILGLLFWRGLSLDPHQLPSTKINQSLPPFKLQALLPNSPPLSDKNLRGNIILLNIWASWCESCSVEQGFLLHLAKQGVVIYGINEKDEPEEAREWLTTWGNPYRNIGQDVMGDLALDLGVYGTPETFLLDTNGKIMYRHAGPLTADVWRVEFLPILQKIQQHEK